MSSFGGIRNPAPRSLRANWRDAFTRSRRVATGTIAVTAIIISQLLAWGTGTATASPGHRSLRLACSVPIIGAQQIAAVISWNGPDSIPVGKPSPRLPISVTVHLPSTLAQGIHVLGVASAGGKATASGEVVAPQGDIPISLRLTVPRVTVPASGSMNAIATGTLPALVFTRPGIGEVIAKAVTVHLTPRNASGGVTFPGRFTSRCTLQPGESNVLRSFRIRAARPKPAPSPVRSAHPTTPAPVASRSQPPRPSPSRSRSASPTPAPSPTSTASPHPAPAPTGGSHGLPPLPHGLLTEFVAALAVTAAVVISGGVWLFRRRRGKGTHLTG